MNVTVDEGVTEFSPQSGQILIVDDEATAVENLAHVCRKKGYQVTTRTTGTGAIEALEKTVLMLC